MERSFPVPLLLWWLMIITHFWMIFVISPLKRYCKIFSLGEIHCQVLITKLFFFQVINFVNLYLPLTDSMLIIQAWQQFFSPRFTVPSFQQNDSFCTNHSPSAKHFNTFHYCYWLTPSNGTADNGSTACQAAGGYIGFIESDPDLLSFIHDGLDNYWRYIESNTRKNRCSLESTSNPNSELLRISVWFYLHTWLNI